jgi:hypothetical protein
MKVILTENQHRLLRRVPEIEDIIEPIMDNIYKYLQGDDPDPLSMGIYDMFINMIREKIANRILYRTDLEGDKREDFKKEIKDFIMSNYGSVIRDYYNSHRNINESTHDIKFKRRYEEIDEGIWDWILGHKLNAMDTFAGFLLELSWDVANDVVRKMNIPEEDYVMYRNQLIRFIKNNFYTELKEFWDSKNINESDGERSIQRRYMMVSDYLDKNMKPDDVCKYNDPIDFVDVIMDNIFNMLIEHIMFDEEHESLYQYIYDFMSENFGDRILKFYDDNSFLCKDEEGNWINESTDTKDYQLMIRRRMSDITEIVENVLDDSDPCEYSRFNQYKRFIYNNVMHGVFYYSTVLQSQKIEFQKEEIEKFKDDLLKVMSLFDDMIRKYYDTYGKHNCPDDPEIVNESISKDHISFTRRYEIIKDLIERGIDVLAQEVDICDYVKAAFLNEVCWQVSDNMEELNMNTESVDTIEKIQRWVKIYFGAYINNEFDKLMDLNCYGSFDDAEEW